MLDNFKVNIDEYFNQYDDKDVLSFETDKLVNVGQFKNIVHQSFLKYINGACSSISSRLSWNDQNFWFNEGKECEILKAGSKGWQKGKIRVNVTLEFIPDESDKIESPLDDVRQEFNQSNS